MKTEWTYRWADLPWLIVGALSYALLEKTVLDLYSTNALLSIFWPGAGLAVAMLLFRGNKYWPVIFAGTCAGMLWTDQALGLTLVISLVRTLEGVFGVWLLTRTAPFDTGLKSLRAFFRLVLLAGVLSPLLSALAGSCILFWLGYMAPRVAVHEFVLWWMGDLVGVVVIAPLILVWRSSVPAFLSHRIPEGVALLVLTFLLGQIIFLDWFSDIFIFINRGFWVYPIVCWAAVRFGLHGVMLVMLLNTGQALAGAALGIGTYGYSLASTQLFNFWSHTLILTMIGIALAIVFAERERIRIERETSESRFLSLFENMLDAYAHCRLICRDGKPVDYEFITVNPAFEKVTGLKNVVGRRVCEVVPDYAEKNQDSLHTFAKVVQDGLPMRWEHYFSATDRWFAFAVYRPAPGEFICITDNITGRKKAEEELRKLSLAVTQCPVSIVITDLQARIQYVNPAFSLVSGYHADEVIGQNPRVLQSGRTPGKVYEELWTTLQAGNVWRGEFINQRKSGEEFIESATIAPLRQSDGRITHYVGVKSDITEHKRAMVERYESETRLSLAKNAANLGLFDHDIATGALEVDARTREIWGFAPAEPINLEMLIASVHPDDLAATRADFNQAYDPAGSGKFEVEYRVIRRADGSIRHVMATGQVFFEAGCPVRSIGFVRDISLQKQPEKEVTQQRSEMENVVNQQVAAQTAAAIAHELNQPLVAILAYSEAALRMLHSEKANRVKFEHALESAIEQTQRAGRTLNELLNFLHQSEVSQEVVDLNEIIRVALAIAQENDHGRFQAQVELEQDLPPVKVNRLQLQKVLVNLFHNGIEAMRNAGIPAAAITIRVQTMAEKNMALVTVQDKGPGLDAQTVHRIFDPFFTTKPAGLGLGLAISRSLIEANGGQLWADIKAGPGATFHIALPFAS